MEFPVNFEMWQLIVGIMLPLLIAVVIKPDWPKLRKYWVAFAMCVAASIGDVWFSGHFVLADLGGTLLKVVFLCFTSYLTFWKPSGIAEGVEKKVLGGKKMIVIACLVLPLAAGGALGLQGCSLTGKYKAVYAVADWVYINHQSLQSRYDTATPEERAWLYENVNPIMNVAKHAVVGIKAMDLGDDITLAGEISAIEKEISAGKIDYDVSQLIYGLRTKDYDVLQLELVKLQRFIRGLLI
jgi:hypothetical protein